MTEYFTTRDGAEQFIREWYTKNKTPPVFFGKIFNHGSEKWIVNYDARQNPRSSPHIKVLEDHSNEIRQLVTSIHSQKQPLDDPALYSSLAPSQVPPIAMIGTRFVKNLSGSEGVFYEYGTEGHRMFLFFDDITPDESSSVQSGRLELGLLVPNDDILFLCYRFSGSTSVGWGDGPYNWHMQELASPPTDSNVAEELVMSITLVSLANEMVFASRLVKLSFEFSRSLMSAIRTQSVRPKMSREQHKALKNDVYERYPDAGSMVANFTASCTATDVTTDDAQTLPSPAEVREEAQEQPTVSPSRTLNSKYNVVVGENGTAQAVKENAFREGEGVAALVTFVDSLPTLSSTGDHLLLRGRLKCSCGKEFPFEKKFFGGRGGGESRCPSCGKGCAAGFHYPTSGYKSGFFVYFCPNRPESVSFTIEDIVLIDGAKKREQEAQAKEAARQTDLQQPRERDEQERKRIATLKRRRFAEGKCTRCGGSLGFLDWVFARPHHRNCREIIT